MHGEINDVTKFIFKSMSRAFASNYYLQIEDKVVLFQTNVSAL